MIKPDAKASLSQWLAYLEHIHSKSIDLGLARVSAVAASLDVLKPAPFVFTVAGTNGKGTTCRMLEMILLEAGFRVGVYSSPHLLSYTERVRIQNQELPESEHVAAFTAIEAARKNTSLTYFEFSTLAALMLFKQHAVDVAILEVGLGGRLDATNCVDSDSAVITAIGLDHTDWLGNTRESIGREKAGIIRHGKPVIVGDPDMPHSICEAASDIGAHLYVCEPNKGASWSYVEQGETWSFQSARSHFEALPKPHIPLANAATALAALSFSSLTVSQEAVMKGIDKATLPGRFQILSNEPRVIIDVAHNPHAAAYLAKKLSASSRENNKTIAVVGMLADKDIAGTLAELQDDIDVWYFAPLPGPRGTTREQMQQFIPAGIACSTVIDAFNQAKLAANKNDTIIVFGSFITVSDVLATLNS